MFIIKADSRNVRAVAKVNGVPLASMSGHDISESGTYARRWFKAGPNSLELVVEGPTPAPVRGENALPDNNASGRLPSEGSDAWAQIVKLPDGLTDGPVEGQIVAEVRWNPDTTETDSGFPVYMNTSFEADHANGMLWLNSRIPQLQEGRAEVLAWLRYLISSLEEGNSGPLVEAIRPALQDASNGAGANTELAMRDFEQFIGSISGGLRFRPFEDRDIRFELVGDGRLLDCKRTDGTSAIDTSPQSSTEFSIDSRIGYLNGRWILFS